MYQLANDAKAMAALPKVRFAKLRMTDGDDRRWTLDLQAAGGRMTDEQIVDQFHRSEPRLERLDTKMDQLEKRLGDGFAVANSRLEGLENRLARKADTWVVTAGMGGLACCSPSTSFLCNRGGGGMRTTRRRCPPSAAVCGYASLT
jgi:hypothetical protein